uniref:Uncharacterized protein n=1 Tax=Tanacetum cinerariifolium TaxID=118510 RepID=A0A699J105_TANCI|nr:hypothetical protein [Tanacetum cinerariifolium]
MMHSCEEIPVVAEVVIDIEPEPTQNKPDRFFTCSMLLGHIGDVLNLEAIRGGLLVRMLHLWSNYYLQVVFAEEGVIMPRSALTFIISTMLAFVEIKSQGKPGFPFETHPRAIMVSITSLPVYGLASAAELWVSASGLDHTSVYANIARLDNDFPEFERRITT